VTFEKGLLLWANPQGSFKQFISPYEKLKNMDSFY